MKVGELIALLEEQDPDLEVTVSIRDGNTVRRVEVFSPSFGHEEDGLPDQVLIS